MMKDKLDIIIDVLQQFPLCLPTYPQTNTLEYATATRMAASVIAAIDSIDTPVFVAKDQWQPIETAPVDIWVLISVGKSVEKAYQGSIDKKWRWHDSDGRNGFAEGCGPTRWMPLPTPPGEE